MRKSFLCGTALVLGLVTSGCDGGDDHDHDHDLDLDHDHIHIISRVELTFTPDAGGDPVTATFSDPDGDGGMSGTSDPIELTLGTTYTLTIKVLNELESPTEDVTEEIEELAEEHLMLIYGDGVGGPATTSSAPLVTHAYADVESDYAPNDVGDDLPVGLRNTITANAEGMSELSVMLRHLPPLNDEPQKRADLPGLFANDSALPGDVDVDVSFELNVVP